MAEMEQKVPMVKPLDLEGTEEAEEAAPVSPLEKLS